MAKSQWITPQEWYESLDPDTRAIADRKIAILQHFNADDPLGWIASEMRENIPQTARFLFLHRVRAEVINGYLPFGVPDNEDFEKSMPVHQRLDGGEQAFKRLVAAGVDVEDIIRVARAATCMAAFNFVAMLDEVKSSHIEEVEDAPDWVLMERVKDHNRRKLTGRCVDGLHESIYDLYPEDH